MRRFNSGLITSIGLLFLFSCSDTATNESVKMPEAPAPKTYVVTIAQMKFSPAELHLNMGDTVIWINKDIVDHTVTEEFNHEWSSPVISNGQSWRTEIIKNAAYFCTIHPVMKGKLFLNK